MDLFRRFKRKTKKTKNSDQEHRKPRQIVEFFSKIPGHLQTDILKRLEFKDFVKFKQCSKETVEISKNHRYRLPASAHQINLYKDFIRVDIDVFKRVEYDSFKDEPILFISEELNVYSTTSNGIQMEDFVRKFVSTAENLTFGVDGITDSSTLNNLIKISKATSLNISDVTNLSDLIKQPEIKKLKEILLFHKKMEEADLLHLEMPKIYVSRDHGLTLQSINKFLKQWVDNRRKVDELTILPIPREEDHLEIFEDLEFSVEGTPKNRMSRIQVRHIYSLTRKDGKKLFLSLDHFDDQPRIIAGEHADLISFVRSQYRWAQM